MGQIEKQQIMGRIEKQSSFLDDQIAMIILLAVYALCSSSKTSYTVRSCYCLLKSSSVKSTFIDGLKVTDEMEIAQVSCSCSANIRYNSWSGRTNSREIER